MVRQFIHGQRFFHEHFGVTLHRGLDPRRVRLPGVASPALPARRLRAVPHPEDVVEPAPTASPTTRSGGRASTARRCSPTSRRSTATTRCSSRSSSAKAERQFAEKGRATRSLHALRLRRRRRRPDPRHAASGTGGCATSRACPRSRSSRPRSSSTRRWPSTPTRRVWVGELYFEMHRGTYTSQAATKQGNRRCELLLREAELWSVAAYGTTGPRTATRPRRSTASGRGAAAPVPRHPPGLVDRLGPPRGRGDLRRADRRARGRSSPARWPRLVAGRRSAVGQRRAARPRRGRGAVDVGLERSSACTCRRWRDGTLGGGRAAVPAHGLAPLEPRPRGRAPSTTGRPSSRPTGHGPGQRAVAVTVDADGCVLSSCATSRPVAR